MNSSRIRGLNPWHRPAGNVAVPQKQPSQLGTILFLLIGLSGLTITAIGLANMMIHRWARVAPESHPGIAAEAARDRPRMSTTLVDTSVKRTHATLWVSRANAVLGPGTSPKRVGFSEKSDSRKKTRPRFGPPALLQVGGEGRT